MRDVYIPHSTTDDMNESCSPGGTSHTNLVIWVKAASQLADPALCSYSSERPRATVVVEPTHLQKVGQEVHASFRGSETQVVKSDGNTRAHTHTHTKEEARDGFSKNCRLITND